MCVCIVGGGVGWEGWDVFECVVSMCGMVSWVWSRTEGCVQNGLVILGKFKAMH